MNHCWILLGLLVAPMAAQAQTPDPTAYAQTITAADLEKHLRVLAADDMEGRETGTRGQKKAADYIAKHFKSEKLAAIVKNDKGIWSFNG